MLHMLLALVQAYPATVPPTIGRVDAFLIHSSALEVEKSVTVYLPASYDTSTKRYPTVYYLHGAGGNERSWVDVLHLNAVADSLAQAGLPEALLVMPDGDMGYWIDWATPEGYATVCANDTLLALLHEDVASFCVSHGRYETYLVSDVVPAVDARYRTRADARHRATAGLSMGGYGAFLQALRHPDLWGAAVSHSGILAPLYIGPHPYNGHPQYASTVQDVLATWGALRRPLFLVEFGSDTSTWWARDPLRHLSLLLSAHLPPPRLFFDVGTSDRLAADQNRAFDDTLTRLRVPHTFAEWPGGVHDAHYWRAHEGEGLAWLLQWFSEAPP